MELTYVGFELKQGLPRIRTTDLFQKSEAASDVEPSQRLPDGRHARHGSKVSGLQVTHRSLVNSEVAGSNPVTENSIGPVRSGL